MMTAAPNAEALTIPRNAIQNTEPRVRAAAPDDLAAVERLLTASGLPLDGVREALTDFVVAQAGPKLERTGSVWRNPKLGK
jgi:hypothetical protein